MAGAALTPPSLTPVRTKWANDFVTNPPRKPRATPKNKVAADTAGYEAIACSHGCDLSVEAFDAARRKALNKPSEPI